MSETITFEDLLVGAQFNFSRYLETGLLEHLNKPGLVQYEKISARKWRRLDTGWTGQVGSKFATVWPAP